MKLRRVLPVLFGLVACGDNAHFDVGPQPAVSEVTTVVNEDGSVTVTIPLNGDDADAMTFSASKPQHGTVTGTGPVFVYHPSGNFSGTDSFRVTITDGEKSVIVPVFITVGAVNDAPIAVNDAFTTQEDTQLVFPTSAVLANDHDVDSPHLTVTAVTQPVLTICLGPTNCGPTVTLANEMITYRPPHNFHGAQTFQYTVSDGQLTADGTITVTVTGVNDAPVANDDLVEGAEDTTLVIPMATLLANDYDVDGQTPMVTAVGDAGHGSVAIDGTTVVYIPDADYNGDDGFTYTISDGSLTASAFVSLAILPVDDAPVAVAGSASTAEATPVDVTVAATDVDSTILTFAVASQPTNGTVTAVGAVFTYAPDVGFFGSDSFTFTASDGTSTSAAATVTITVTEVVSNVPELLYYKFEQSGITVTNLASSPPPGTATATLVEAATQTGAGVCGSGALLGTGVAGDYLNTGWTTNLTGIPWTISFWSFNVPVVFGYIFGDQTAGSFRCFTSGAAGSGNWILRGAMADVLAPGGAGAGLHMTTFVYDPTAATIVAYVDGVLVNTVPEPSVTITGTGAPFEVGELGSSAGLPAGATLDEFSIYSHALSAADVTALFTSSSSCPGT